MRNVIKLDIFYGTFLIQKSREKNERKEEK